MGLLDMVEQMAAGSGNADHARVAGGLVQEMQERPGGLGGLLQSFPAERVGRRRSAVVKQPDATRKSSGCGKRSRRDWDHRQHRPPDRTVTNDREDGAGCYRAHPHSSHGVQQPCHTLW